MGQTKIRSSGGRCWPGLEKCGRGEITWPAAGNIDATSERVR